MTTNMRWLLIVALAFSIPEARAGEKELEVPKEGLKIEGTVEVKDPRVTAKPYPKANLKVVMPAKVYQVKMSANKPYLIEMIGKSPLVSSILMVQDSEGNQQVYQDHKGHARTLLHTWVFFTPPQDGTYKVFAGTTGWYGKDEVGKFTLQITEPDVKKVAKEGLTLAGTVAQADARVALQPVGKDVPKIARPLPAKVFYVELTAGKNYRFEMNAEDKKQLDPFLVVQSKDGRQLLAFDNDGGGDLNARLSLTVTETSLYKVFAAANSGEGNFTLKITEISN